VDLLDIFLGERELLDATRRDIEAWRAAMESTALSPSTICKRMSAVSGLYAFAFDEGLVTINPAARARRPRVPSESPRRGLSPAEVRAMLDTCDDTLVGLRDQMVLTVLAVQGWRVGSCSRCGSKTSMKKADTVSPRSTGRAPRWCECLSQRRAGRRSQRGWTPLAWEQGRWSLLFARARW